MVPVLNKQMIFLIIIIKEKETKFKKVLYKYTTYIMNKISTYVLLQSHLLPQLVPLLLHQ